MDVQFFHTCLVNEVDPEVGLAAVRVLERLGCRVEVPRAQTCCGQPAYNGGFHDEAAAAARHTVELLDTTTGPVIVPSGSCADMIVHQFPPNALPHDVFTLLPAPCTGSSARDEQPAAEIGVTAYDAAIAETGSLVLLSAPGRARTVSLLPRTHLAIVRRDDIVPTLADTFERLHDRLCATASCTVITGPSRTADIELTLTLGIHGPGHLIVVIAP